MNTIPFTIYMKIVPDRANGKRFELIRSRERMAWHIYNDLNDNLSNANMALPGGDGVWSIANDLGSFSKLINIVAVKPQFGEEPDMATVVGFYQANVGTPYPEYTIINANEFKTGPIPGAPGWRADLNPSADNAALVKTLKAAVEAAVTSVDFEIIKIELNGVKYGRGGYHFPQ